MPVSAIDTEALVEDDPRMSERQSRNVSLAPEQDRFVREMVEGGRYRSASEVVREGLRLLELQEHRRLLEKWIYRGLDADEEARLPEQVRERVRSHFETMIDEALEEVRRGEVVDGPEAMRQLRARIESRSE